MKITKKTLPKSQIELTIEIPFSDILPSLKKTAKNINLPGFRAGNVPYEIIKEKIGEEKLFQDSMPNIIQNTLLGAFLQENLEVIGEPKVEPINLKVNEPFIYKALISVLPKIKLNGEKEIKAERKEVKAEVEEIKKVIDEMREQYVKEAIVARTAKMGDKVLTDISMSINKVPLENGQFKNQPIILGEKMFPNEMSDNLAGAKKGEEKKFEIEYPKEHFDKKIAGKIIEFTVKLNEIYERILPEVNNEFARGLGDFENLEKLNKYIENLILTDKKRHEEERFEEEILKKVIEKSEVEELPDILIESETEKMLKELEHNVASQGGKFDDYLNHIKKTAEELKKDFKKRAEERIKISLAIKEIAKNEKIEIEEKEIEEEINKILNLYPNNPKIKAHTQEKEYKNYLKNILLNKKTIDKLKEWATE